MFNPSTKQLEKLVIQIKDNEKKLPQGSLIIKNTNPVQYYHRINGKSVYIKQDNKELVRNLVQKKYEHNLHKLISKELIHRKAAKKPIDLSKAYFSIKPRERSLITELIETDYTYVNKWLSQDIRTSWNTVEDDSFITDNNERVRSKSELIIANKLKAAKIAYLYEKPLRLEKTYYPDFTILRSDRTEIIWEHFGRMGEAYYREKCFEKIHNYAIGGYILGKNFIATFEEADIPLSTFDIDCVINMLLGR